MKKYKNKIILFDSNLYVVEDIYDNVLIMSKLNSGFEMEEFNMQLFNDMKFDFEQARIDAVNIMNQTRYYDNVLKKSPQNKVM